MIKYFLLVLIFSVQKINAQSFDSISTIVIRYDKGHYNFGHSGQYSIGEQIEYSKTSKSSFKMTRYCQFKKFYDSINKHTVTDTTILKTKGPTISNEEIQNLIIELNTSKYNYTADFVKPYLTPPSKKQIFLIAKKYDLKYKFDDEYLERKEKRNLIKKIKHYSKLDTFLQARIPNPENELVIIDVWNVLSIKISTKTDTIQYISHYYNFLGQPIIKVVNKNYINAARFVNLEINNKLGFIIPKKSIIKQTTALDQLKDVYIKWYLENEP